MGQASQPRDDVQMVVDAVWSALKSVDHVTAGSSGGRERKHAKLFDRSSPQLRHTMEMLTENTLARDPECLADIPQPSLKKLMEPIIAALRSIDAKTLLNLQRVANGTGPRIDDNTSVRPIYERVRPPIGNIEPSAGRSCVRYLHIDEIPDQYSMGIFIFAPNAKIPLHDHPNMCVLSRVLYGSLERLSLDLARDDDTDTDDYHSQSGPVHSLAPDMKHDEQHPYAHNDDGHDKPPLRRESSSDSEHQQATASTSGWLDSLWFRRKNSFRHELPAGSKRAFKNHIDRLQAPDVTVLYPFEGNLHEFVAGPEGAAVLDVLVPPYDHVNNRDCTFYYIQDIDKSLSSSSAWAKSSLAVGKSPCYIVPTGQPEDFHCISGQYGPFGSFDGSDS